MHNKNELIADICKTIQPSDKIDPFEGLDLDDICVSPDHINAAFQKQNDHVSNTSPSSEHPQKPVDVNFVIIPDEAGAESNPNEHNAPESNDRYLSEDISRPPAKQKTTFINPLIEKAYHYAELTRIREKVFSSLEESGGKSLLITSPHDNTGSSFLAGAMAYIGARSYLKKVLLIDSNMRRAGLHELFGVPQSYGFTDLIRNNIPWQAVVKETGVENLSIITAGDRCENFAEYIRHSHIPTLLDDVQKYFDLIVFDTSPVLTPNRNNVNIVSLTSVVDYFLLITKQSGTTKEDLKETKNVIEAGNGTIHGIVLNEYSPEKQKKPYPN